MALNSTQLLAEMNTSDTYWGRGCKGGRSVGLKPCHFHVPIV